MLEALLWGLFAASSLIIGAAIGLAAPVSKRVIGLVMAFGAGVLISAVAFELTDEAFQTGGADAVAAGLALGALLYFAANVAVSRYGGRHRKRSGGQQSGGAATGIVIGTLMDGIPESAAIGLTLVGGGKIGVAVVAAVFLSNLPEAMSASVGLRASGRSATWIIGLWALVSAVSSIAALIGFLALDGASDDVVAGMQAFAGGAILTMLADTMMPEAASEPGNGPFLGVVTVVGFAAAFLLSRLS
jgi:ZIP family zinc transporter